MSVLAGLQQLVERADEAPWTWLPDDSEESPRGWCRFGGASALNESGYATAPNAELIVALRNAAPALLAVVAAIKAHHARTGYCPFCEAGPPPHHNDGCPLSALAAVGEAAE